MTAPEVRLDFRRAERIGLDEAILCAGKSVAQLETILSRAAEREQRFLFTRLAQETFGQLPAHWRRQLDYDEVSRTAVYGRPHPSLREGLVAVVSAGSTDVPAAREAGRTLVFNGIATTDLFDVGVAGLWRLLEHTETLAAHPVVIAAAGMDAALPSVLGGLLPSVVIALPTSTGYGAARGGETALAACLVSCAPGLVVVNIDNGYGAACAALRMLNALGPGPEPARGG